MRRDRVAVRLVAVTVMAGVVAAIGGALLVERVARSAVREEISQRNAAIAEELAVRLDIRVESIADHLRIAATQPAVAGARPTAEPDLRAVLAAANVFDELILVDRSGQVVAAAATSFLASAADYQPRPEIVGATGGGMYVGLLDTFPPVLELAIPVESPPGNPQGALIGRVPLELMAPHLQQLDPGSGAVRSLVASDGRYLVHPARDLVAEGARLPDASLLSGGPRQAVLEIDGERSLVAVAPTVHLPAAVLVERNEADALVSVRRDLLQLGLLVLAAIGAAVIAVTLAAHHLLRPLGPLGQAVERLERGERGVRVAGKAKGEIGLLGRQLNRMAEALDRRREEADQLYRLSLLLSSHAERSQVVDEVVRDVRLLLHGQASGFLSFEEDGALHLESATGERKWRQAMVEAAEAARAAGDAVVDEIEQGAHVAAVPLRGVDGESRGVLALVRAEEALTGEERQLLRTFASFAGVALENVRRLELEQTLVGELQQAVDRRRELLGHVSHDLRVPIVCIEAFSDRLRRDWGSMSDEEREELMTEIEEQARLLDDLVGKLLEHSAPERGRQRLALAPVPIRRPLAAALEEVRQFAGDRPIETDVREVEVLADSTLLTRALTHILSNAVRYSPPGTPVRVRVTGEGAAGRIDVSDEGSGLSPEEAARVFEPFWRKAPGAAAGAGLGLGLTLAAEYVREMGGSIELDSRPGGGSTFTIRLPLATTVRAGRPVAGAIG